MGGPSTTFVHDTPRPLSLVSSNNHLLCFCLDLSLSRTPHSLLPYLTFFAVYLLNLLIMHASLIALAASLSVASAVTRGFNYGAATTGTASGSESLAPPSPASTSTTPQSTSTGSLQTPGTSPSPTQEPQTNTIPTGPSSTSTTLTTTNAAGQMKASSFIGLVGAAAALIAFA